MNNSDTIISLFRMWDFLGRGMFAIWDVQDVGCLECGMWDVGCLPGCGMLIYEMP